MEVKLNETVLSLTARIVEAHVAHNEVGADTVPALVRSVYQALAEARTPEIPTGDPKPAVDPKQSVYPSHIVCLECGDGLQLLKQHLRVAHGLTPEQYRAKWELPPTYPLVAPTYATMRSGLAKMIGLGLKRPEPTTRKTPVQTTASQLDGAPGGPKVTIGRARRAKGSRG